MLLNASILAPKGSIINARVYDPAQIKWWTGVFWSALESEALLVTLSIYALIDPVDDRYHGLLTIPIGSGYSVEYIDFATGIIVGQDEGITGDAAAPVASTGTTVQDVINSLLPKLASRPEAATELYEQLNDIIEVISRRLWFHRSDLLKATTAVVVNPVNTGFIFDNRFLGFRGLPYESNPSGSHQVRQLSPLSEDDEWRYQQPGTPRFYQLIGNSVALFPAPATEFTFIVRYYALPSDLVDQNSPIPFNGLFDTIIKDMALAMVQGMFTIVSPVFIQTLNEIVDKTIRLRPNRTVKWRNAV
jgi:hypothetical protein